SDLAVLDSNGKNDAAPWHDKMWGTRIKLTFGNASQTESLRDFPVLVVLDSSRIDYTKTQDAGQDLRFIDADGKSLLAHEIEGWNESDLSHVWVKVPLIDDSSGADHIWLYYNNASASDGRSPTSVWNSSFQGVWHLSEHGTGASGEFADSTANNNDGTGGAGTAKDVPSRVTAKIGEGQDFDGQNDYIEFPNSKGLETIQEDDYTVEAWLNPDQTPPGQSNPDNETYFGIMIKKGRHAGLIYTGFTYPNTAVFSHYLSGPTHLSAGTPGVYLPGTFVHVVGVLSRAKGTLSIYANGQRITTTTFTPGAKAYDYGKALWRIGIGSPGTATYRNATDGKIDEVRISSVARSDDWIAAQYLSMNDSFITYGKARSAE
ncbi:MAG: DUF2341 domain-containing protein, partial [Lentisphaeria bacterium]|nr:DUF2341 domain-containing protein [Lentisphaeria bacterium]